VLIFKAEASLGADFFFMIELCLLPLFLTGTLVFLLAVKGTCFLDFAEEIGDFFAAFLTVGLFLTDLEATLLDTCFLIIMSVFL